MGSCHHVAQRGKESDGASCAVYFFATVAQPPILILVVIQLSAAAKICLFVGDRLGASGIKIIPSPPPAT